MPAPSDWTWTRTVPKWSRTDDLFPSVPWLWRGDLDEGRRALWELDHQGERKASCWAVSLYPDRGSSQTAYVVMRAERGNGNDGGRITLALSETPLFSDYAKASMANAAPVQSGTMRRRWLDVDYWREDGA